MAESTLQAIAPVASGWHQSNRFFDGSTWTAAVTHFGPVPCRGCGSD